MEQVTIDKARYDELLQYELAAMKRARKNTKSAEIVMQAMIMSLHDALDGRVAFTFEMRDAMKSLYTSGGDRARAKAFKSGLETLKRQGKIEIGGYKGSRIRLIE